MQLVLDILSWAFIMAGGGFMITGAIGVIRMPDFYTRLHAAGMTDTMGASFLIFGMLMQAGFSLSGVKLVLIMLFIVITSPIATHALINAAYMAKTGIRLAPDQTNDGHGGDTP